MGRRVRATRPNLRLKDSRKFPVETRQAAKPETERAARDLADGETDRLRYELDGWIVILNHPRRQPPQHHA